MPNILTQSPPAVPAAPHLVAVRAATLSAPVPELEFDATVRVAAAVFGAPMAFVALVEDGRLAFKASIGIDLLLLKHGFGGCADVLVQPFALYVAENLPLDEQLRANPLVSGQPQLRFYAGAPVLDAAGKAIGTVAVLDVRERGITEAQGIALRDMATVVRVALQARQHAADLTRHAMLDPLTGVASRAQFDQALSVEMQHAMRTGEPFTLLLLSLDGIGDIRNGFGLAAADAALREVAARLTRQVRLGDVLSRLEGEEFGVVMRHGAGAEAEMLAARVIAAVREPLILDSGEAVGVRVCIGIAAYDDRVESVAALTAQAGQALQQARRQHERRWNFFGRRFEAPALRLVTGDEVGPEAAGLAPGE